MIDYSTDSHVLSPEQVARLASDFSDRFYGEDADDSLAVEWAAYLDDIGGYGNMRSYARAYARALAAGESPAPAPFRCPECGGSDVTRTPGTLPVCRDCDWTGWRPVSEPEPEPERVTTLDVATSRLLLNAYNALSDLLHDIRSKDAALPAGSPAIVSPAYALRADIWSILNP